KPPDLDEPYMLPQGSTVEALAEKIHKDFIGKLKTARIWGKAVRDGQMVQRDYVFEDGDVVELQV
ncbi:MAG TPA: TGS domain-containing protein, partial [Syntrophales bacterium]|nr:TGS domain-containing protein [Syntrophales bacterium]